MEKVKEVRLAQAKIELTIIFLGLLTPIAAISSSAARADLPVRIFLSDLWTLLAFVSFHLLTDTLALHDG